MSEDRRTARRVRLPGVEVTYESATGERRQARVVDLSREGLFIPSATPLGVGKRLSLEIQPIGEPTVWSALGRVVWTREADEDAERPAGMAVKIIDAEDSVLAGIAGLLEAREPTERGLGFGDTILPVRPRARSNPPAREKTVLGIGADATPAPEAPILITAPGRESTLLGVGLAESTEGPHEVSLAIDLVVKKPPSVRPVVPGPVVPEPVVPGPVVPGPVVPEPVVAQPTPPHEQAFEPEPALPPSPPSRPEPEAEPEPERPVRRRSGGWLIFLVLLAGGAAAVYVFRDRVALLWQMAASAIAKQLK